MYHLPSSYLRAALAGASLLALFGSACAGTTSDSGDDAGTTGGGGGAGRSTGGGGVTGSGGITGAAGSGPGSGGAAGTGTGTGGTGGDATGAGGAGGVTTLPTGVHVQYRCTECTSSSYSVGLHFAVKNLQPTPIVLAVFSMRYWFTAAPLDPSALKVHCETVQPSALIPCDDLVLKIVPVSPPRTGADSYIEMSFTGAAPQVGWMGSIPQLDVRFETSTAPGLTQSDDYSFDGTMMTLADSMKVTAYVDGNLVWGVEP